MAKKIKKLTKPQLAIIEQHSKWMQIKKMEVEIAELKFLNRRLQSQMELQELNTKSEMLKKAVSGKIESHKGSMQKIADILKIKGKWSFDPDTGEVKED